MRLRILRVGMLTHGFWCGFQALRIPHSHRFRIRRGYTVEWENIW